MAAQIDYTDYLDDVIRISYETETLSTSILTVDEVVSQDKSVQDLYEEKARKEIVKRKQVMAGLHKEVRELERLIE